MQLNLNSRVTQPHKQAMHSSSSLLMAQQRSHSKRLRHMANRAVHMQHRLGTSNLRPKQARMQALVHTRSNRLQQQVISNLPLQQAAMGPRLGQRAMAALLLLEQQQAMVLQGLLMAPARQQLLLLQATSRQRSNMAQHSRGMGALPSSTDLGLPLSSTVQAPQHSSTAVAVHSSMAAHSSSTAALLHSTALLLLSSTAAVQGQVAGARPLKLPTRHPRTPTRRRGKLLVTHSGRRNLSMAATAAAARLMALARVATGPPMARQVSTASRQVVRRQRGPMEQQQGAMGPRQPLEHRGEGMGSTGGRQHPGLGSTAARVGRGQGQGMVGRVGVMGASTTRHSMVEVQGLLELLVVLVVPLLLIPPRVNTELYPLPLLLLGGGQVRLMTDEHYCTPALLLDGPFQHGWGPPAAAQAAAA